MQLEVNLSYKDTGFGYMYTLTTSNGLGLQVDYLTKPTKKQIRRQIKALKGSVDFSKSYCKVKGGMV